MMAFIQKVTPPPNKVFNFSLKDFSGGMNNRFDQLSDNEGAIIKNLMFADETVLETRYGQKYYSDVVYDGEVIFIDEYKPYRGDNQLIIGTTKTLYIGDKTISLKGKPSGVNHLGKYYFTDGEKLKVYAKYHDVDEIKDEERNKGDKKKQDEDKNITDASKTTTYRRYIGTPIDGYDFYDVVSPPDGHAQLTTEHTQGVRVVDYTKKQVYYEPCKNEVEDALKGFCKVPEKVKYIVSHDGRLFTSGHDKDDDNVFITDLQNPLYYAVSLPIQLPPTSDKITAMCVFDNSVVIGRENDIYVILGSTNRPNIGVEVFKLKKLNSHTGMVNHQSVNIAHNYLIFLGSDGNVYALQNTKTYERDLATQILTRTIDLCKEPINLNKNDYKNATSYFFNDEWYLSINDITMVYSYRHRAWTMYTGLKARSCYGINGEWIWGRPEGKIATFDKVTFLDFGYPYESLFYSKVFDMDESSSYKQFREFFLLAHTFMNEYSDIYVTFEVDYYETKDRLVISNKLSKWGEAKWGDRFINKNINESSPFIIGKRGKTIRFKIKNGYEESGTIPTIIDKENNVDNLLNYPGKRDGTLVKVIDEGIYYLYMNKIWIPMTNEEMNQRMKIYQISGDYELRGKR